MKEDKQQPKTPCYRQWSRSILGWLIRVHYDCSGWWLTDKKNYRNTFVFAYTVITDSNGRKARRFNAWNLMVEWGYMKDHI